MGYTFSVKPWFERVADRSTLPEFQVATIRVDDPSLLTESYDVDSGAYTSSGDATIYTGRARIIGARWGVNAGGESQANATTLAAVTIQVPRTAFSRVKRGCKVFVMASPGNPVLTGYVFTVTSDLQGSSAAARTFEAALDVDASV